MNQILHAKKGIWGQPVSGEHDEVCVRDGNQQIVKNVFRNITYRGAWVA